MKYLSIGLLAALVSIAFPLTSEGYYEFNYGDQTGDTMVFHDVTESTFTHDDALYGTPSTIGDTLMFDLTNFGQFVSGGDSMLMDGMLETTIESLPGTYIGAVRFAEYGDVSLGGSGGVDTYAAVSNAIYLKVKRIDGEAKNVPTLVVSTSFSPSDGDWDLFHDGVVTGLPWQGVLYVNLDEYLQGLGYPGHATEVDLTMDNTLNNGSEADPFTTSFIRKKETDGIQITPLQEIPVPEPTTFVIIGGLLLVIIRGRRKF